MPPSRKQLSRAHTRRGEPSGRGHVSEIQRARILTAMTELVRDGGTTGVSIAQIVERSGVSRRTFYELFDDREDCFLAAFDRAVARAAAQVVPAYNAPGCWRERVRGGLEALLCFLEEEPAMGYLCIVGALGAGPDALARRARVTTALVSAVHEGRSEARAGRRIDRLAAEGVVGAVLTVLHTRLQQRDDTPLLPLLSSLTGIVVLPYLGTATAERELARRAPRARPRAHADGDPFRDLEMRLTYRTVRVLSAIAATSGASNREVGAAAGVADQGQISKLLSRLHTLGLIEKRGGDHARGEPNAWALTGRGAEVVAAIDGHGDNA